MLGNAWHFYFQPKRVVKIAFLSGWAMFLSGRISEAGPNPPGLEL